MADQLLQANLNSSLDKLNEVNSLLLDIKSAWEQIPAEHHHTQSPTKD
jgi:flagellar protein FliS